VSNFFNFFSTNRAGIVMFLLVLGAVMLLVQWLTWLLGWGRFRNPTPRNRRDSLRLVFSDAMVKIINDFRHLLALVIVVIFATVLWYVMLKTSGDAETMNDAIQTVVASLGGLVGSIIGYYFGESAVARAQGNDQSLGSGSLTNTQRPSQEEIEPVPQPPAQE
jgi:di/tricarboxylate transporter